MDAIKQMQELAKLHEASEAMNTLAALGLMTNQERIAKLKQFLDDNPELREAINNDLGGGA